MGRILDIATKLGKLVEEKNAAYGSAFQNAGKVLQVLYPDGIRPDQMIDALIVTRILDKLFRIANRKNAFGESPYGDISGYGILGMLNDEDEAETADCTVGGELPPGWRDEVARMLVEAEEKQADINYLSRLYK
jgi:hypothetical protein